MAYWDGYGWPRSETVGSRKAKALKKLADLRKKGHALSPVTLEGKTIAHTFWGKSWCQNLESYSDFANRLGRGRSYVRHGSVIDLQMRVGVIEAQVQGSDLYKVSIQIAPVPGPHWKKVREACSGRIDSVVELLSGRLSHGVMEVLCKRDQGLFPTPKEIHFACSCPDAAWTCKHIAAVLYGVGARLDESPELLFTLRNADQLELVSAADTGALAAPEKGGAELGGDLGELFGIEMAEPSGVPPPRPRKKSKAARAISKKAPAHRKSKR